MLNRKRSLVPVVAATQLCLAFACCSAAAEPVTSRTAAAADAVQSPSWRVGRGDELNFHFTYAPELNTVATVRSDGTVSLPLAGEVVVEGLTMAELVGLVQARLADRVRRPDLVVNLQGAANSQRIFVGGEVVKPGVQSLLGPLTVLQAVTAAEGLRESARADQVLVVRAGRDGQPATTRRVDLAGLMAGHPDAQDVVLDAQDVVIVPRSGIASVDLWVDQYIRRMVPISFGINYSINRYGIGP